MTSGSRVPSFRLATAAYFSALTLGLWFFLVRLPVSPGDALDPSWQVGLIRAHTQVWQFGRDIIFTYGPWGFLLADCHLGRENAGLRLLWEFAGQLGLAVVFIRLIRDLAPWRQLGFVAAVGFFHGRIFSIVDALYLALIVLVVLRRLLVATSAGRAYFLWAAFLGCLSQLKLNFAAAVVFGIVVAAGLAISQRRWRTAVAIAAGGAAGFVVGWVAAGQSLGNIWAYALTSWEIIRGNDGMAVDESQGAFVIGLGLLSVVGFFLWRLRSNRLAPTERWALVGFLAAVWFIAWKHGYTRADSWHLPGFFLFTLYLAVLLPGFYHREKPLHGFDGVGALCLLLLLARSFHAGAVLTEAPIRWITNVRALVGVRQLPDLWENQLLEQRASLGSPRLAELIGSKSIDAYNFNQVEVVVQPVNFAPRPIFQGYVANTPKLIELNRRFFESDRAPEFLLWRQQTIDHRYPTQDDAGLFQVVKQRYVVASTVAGDLLLQKRPVTLADAGARTSLLVRTLALGEICVIPPAAVHQTLWLRVTAVPTWLGRLRAFLYKPAQLYLSTADNAQGNRLWRIVPRAAQSGFLLQPRLETTGEMAAYLSGQALPPVGPFSFVAPKGQERYWQGFEIEITAEPAAVPST